VRSVHLSGVLPGRRADGLARDKGERYDCDEHLGGRPHDWIEIVMMSAGFDSRLDREVLPGGKALPDRETLPSGRTIIKLREALDIDAAPQLRERLIGVLARGAGLLVLDLQDVPSCDVVGLAVLIGTQRRARHLGIEVRLAAPSPAVAKVLSSTGLYRSFTICPDPSGAPGTDLGHQASPAPVPAGPRLPFVSGIAVA
jgi:anti-sigma B factor antagonist